MKIITDTDSYIPTKRAEFEFDGKKMCVAVSMHHYSSMREDTNYFLYRNIEGFLRGQIEHTLKDARFALEMQR